MKKLSSKVSIIIFSLLLVAFLTYLFSGEEVKKTEKKSLEERSAILREEKLAPACEVLKTLATPRGQIRKGDWLELYHEEGQSFAQYVKEKPNRPDKTKKNIYIQLIGEFSEKQLKVLEETNLYMENVFGVPIKKLPAISLDKIPAKAQRFHPTWKNHQLYTKYLMDDLLQPSRPNDALALIGFTGVDLYPDPDWNYVFGIASLTNRVGLWSIYRNGDPSINDETYKICLRRTIGTAIHETGHILGITHCIAYECIMGGCNSIEEADRHELYFCPSCLQKLTWNTNVKPAEHLRRMIKVSDKLKLDKEKIFFEKSLNLLIEKKLVNSL